MELNQQQSLNQTQTQTMALSQAQYQSLQVLMATTQELQTQLTQLVQTNPVIEIRSMGNEIQLGDPLQDIHDDAQKRDDYVASEIERDESQADYLTQDVALSDAQLDYSESLQSASEADKKRQYMFDSLTEEDSPLESLFDQLQHAAYGDDALIRAGEAVIGNLDDNGYLQASVEEIAALAQVPAGTAQRAIEVVQTLEPSGIGGRNARECLLIQMKRRGQCGLAWEIIESHYEELLHNKVPQIAKALGCSVQAVNEAIDSIRDLDPHPGRALLASAAQHVMAEAMVERGEDGGWRVRMNSGCYPVLDISQEYRNLAEDASTTADARKFLKSKILEGRQFIRALDERLRTIEKITISLVHFQEDFFDSGPEKLRPLVLAQIAEDIGMHETTVSRAIANKYLRTPWGLFEYKYFFSGGVQKTDDGEEVSSRVIRQKIREFIGSESPDKPLSDQRISEMLQEQGMDIARRTVAKYRELEGIPTTSLRRIHK